MPAELNAAIEKVAKYLTSTQEEVQSQSRGSLLLYSMAMHHLLF